MNAKDSNWNKQFVVKHQKYVICKLTHHFYFEVVKYSCLKELKIAQPSAHAETLLCDKHFYSKKRAHWVITQTVWYSLFFQLSLLNLVA